MSGFVLNPNPILLVILIFFVCFYCLKLQYLTFEQLHSPFFALVPDMKDMKGVTVGYVACKMELIGIFTLSDSCRTGSAEAIKELRSMGIKSVMLTGDSAAAADYAQDQVKTCYSCNVTHFTHSWSIWSLSLLLLSSASLGTS